MWQLSQKIVRAMPGTDVGKKVALYEKLPADLAVLLAEELKISKLMGERQLLHRVSDSFTDECLGTVRTI